MKPAAASGTALDATVRIVNHVNQPKLDALRRKVERLREHLEGAEAALAVAEKENGGHGLDQ